MIVSSGYAGTSHGQVVVWAWGRVISELVGSDNPCINGQNILATEVVEYMSARGVPVVRVGVIACI